jgi:hypothetical protein
VTEKLIGGATLPAKSWALQVTLVVLVARWWPSGKIEPLPGLQATVMRAVPSSGSVATTL